MGNVDTYSDSHSDSSPDPDPDPDGAPDDYSDSDSDTYLKSVTVQRVFNIIDFRNVIVLRVYVGFKRGMLQQCMCYILDTVLKHIVASPVS